MNQAHGSAGLIVSMGKELAANRNELVTTILPHVKEMLPYAINRVQSSYVLAVFAVVKVTMYMCVHSISAVVTYIYTYCCACHFLDVAARESLHEGIL